jgi:ankyrin repeat protein
MLSDTVCSIVQKKLANTMGNVSGELFTRFLSGRGDNQDPRFFVFLVESGANPNSDHCCEGYADRTGIIQFYTETALHKAVKEGYLDLAKALLDHGADIAAAGGPAGATPLMAAATAGRADLIRLLIDRGAGVNTTDGNGETALQKAQKAGQQQAVDLLRQRGGR